MVASLDNFEEESGAIFNGLGEDLEEISLIIIVDQNVQLLDDVEVFFHINTGGGETLAQVLVVSFRDGQEFHATGLHFSDSVDNVSSAHGNVLDTSTSVVVNVFLDL